MPINNIVGQGLGSAMTDVAMFPVRIDDLQYGTTPPDAVTVGVYRGYAYTIGDDSEFSFIIPVDWIPNSDISLVINWGCNETFAANGGVVQWHAWGEAVTNAATELVGSGRVMGVASGNVNIPATARTLRTTTVGLAYGAGLAAGDTLAVILSRVASSVVAAPTQEPEIYAVWIQYNRYLLWGARQQ
jgi:hypothetical protein